MTLTTPAIFYVPHQDDETLSMSVDILNHIAVGWRVIMVLYSDGGASTAINYINGTASSTYWGGIHTPSTEGYTALTNQQFIDARNNEFIQACLELGVASADIHLEPIGVNESVDLTSMQNLILRYKGLYPGSIHKAMSYHDTHPVHQVGGQALLNLYNAGQVSNARFYVSRADWSTLTIGSTVTATAAQKTTITHAAHPYSAWLPLLGAYAVGYHSVYDQFGEVLANPQNRIHYPNQ